MERSSYFIKDKALFGSFPTQEAVHELEQEGVRYFINLTQPYEKRITPYITNYTSISFPITDRHVPHNWREFSCFLFYIANIINSLKNKELIYIHCKGGHGRSGIVVACLMCLIFKLSPENALEHTRISHSNRSIMRDKWRKLGAPQTEHQKRFVYKFFEPIFFYRAYKTGLTAGFSNFTPHEVEYKNITYPTAEAAIQAHKNPYDQKYLINQSQARTPIISKNLGRKVELRIDWKDVCEELMYEIVKCKFDQHPELKFNLLNTGLRPIIQHTHGDSFWGDGGDGKGLNKLGKVLMRVRKDYYRQIYQELFH